MNDDAIERAKRGNLGQLLLRSARLFDTISFSRFAEKVPAIRRTHLNIMPHLDLDGTRITELARRADITKQAVGQIVDDLEDLGFVERRPDPTDQRAKIVVLTKRGRKGMLEGLGMFKTLETELAEEIGDEAIEDLIRALEAVLPALERRIS